MLAINGKGVCSGVGDGALYKFDILTTPLPEVTVKDETNENMLFVSAIGNLTEALEHNINTTQSTAHKETLQFYLNVLQNKNLKADAENTIKSKKICAQQAVYHAFETYKVSDEYDDNKKELIREIYLSLLYYISAAKLVQECKNASGRLVIAICVPLYTFLLEEIKENVSAVIMPNHASFLPCQDIMRHEQTAAVSVSEQDFLKLSGAERTLVDGQTGDVVQKPEPELLSAYAQKRLRYVQSMRRTQIMRGIDAITQNGVKIELTAEITDQNEARSAIDSDALAVGIFKSSALRTKSDKMYSEHGLFNLIRDTMLLFADKDVSITVPFTAVEKTALNMGKQADECHMAVSKALFGNDEMWREKLIECLLRTSAYGKLCILADGAEEPQDIVQFKEEIAQISKNLKKKNYVISDRVKIGTIINTVAAATITDLIATECDSVVIDARALESNIMQHKSSVISQKEGALNKHPAVLRTFAQVVRMAQVVNTPVSVFGYDVADTLLTSFFASLRINSICLLPHDISATKRTVRGLTQDDCRSALKECLQLVM